MTSTTSASSVEAVFSSYVEHLVEEQQVKESIREILRDIDQGSREAMAALHKVHQPGGISKIPEILAQFKTILESTGRPQLANLGSKVPDNQYYKYHNMFTFSLQRWVFAVAFAHYLQEEKLVSPDDVVSDRYLDLSKTPGKGIHLDLEDYLSGLTQVSNELSRLSVNSVTNGDHARPVRISCFLNDLLNGFRLLNLKNDGLRKRFDSLKYDVKKVEEVVYDLSIRGLINKNNKEEEKKEEKESKKEEGEEEKK